MEYYPGIKKDEISKSRICKKDDEILSFTITWMEPEYIMLNAMK
jgi:hypothetical protein